MVKQTEKPIVIEEMTLSEIKEKIALYQADIEKKKAVVLTEPVKAAKKAYQGLTSQGIAMPVDTFVSSLKELTDEERKTLSNELEGGLKPASFEEYQHLDDIREALMAVAKTCTYKKSGRTSAGRGDRKVKLSNFTCPCPVCKEMIGNPEGHTQKHLVVNQVRLHMLNKHEISKERFNAEYRALVNDTTTSTKDIIEEVR